MKKKKRGGPMKRIMIAGWVTPDEKYENYINTLAKLGAEGFLSLKEEDLEKADGLILPGSFQDMNPKLWGAEDLLCSNDINDELDQIQWQLLEKAAQDKKPVLGICRGMQFINVFFGGTLIQDLPDAAAHKPGEPERYHDLVIPDGTRLHQLFGTKTETNTRHHQGVGVIGDNLNVSAMWMEEDGMVMEAVEHKYLPIIGVQWHPERMMLFGNEQQKEDGKKLLTYWLAL